MPPSSPVIETPQERPAERSQRESAVQKTFQQTSSGKAEIGRIWRGQCACRFERASSLGGLGGGSCIGEASQGNAVRATWSYLRELYKEARRAKGNCRRANCRRRI